MGDVGFGEVASLTIIGLAMDWDEAKFVSEVCDGCVKTKYETRRVATTT